MMSAMNGNANTAESIPGRWRIIADLLSTPPILLDTATGNCWYLNGTTWVRMLLAEEAQSTGSFDKRALLRESTMGSGLIGGVRP